MSRVSVVLAAGAARRFGSDKLSARFRGEALVYHAIRAARAAPVERVVVIAHPALETGVWDGSPAVEVVRLSSGALSETLAAGVRAALGAEGLFVFLGDMPLVPHDIAGRLAAIIGQAFAAVPRSGGVAGHPVLFAARAFPKLAELTGDTGAGRLLRDRDDVAYLEVDDDAILRDVDRPEDLSALG